MSRKEIKALAAPRSVRASERVEGAPAVDGTRGLGMRSRQFCLRRKRTFTSTIPPSDFFEERRHAFAKTRRLARLRIGFERRLNRCVAPPMSAVVFHPEEDLTAQFVMNGTRRSEKPGPACSNIFSSEALVRADLSGVIPCSGRTIAALVRFSPAAKALFSAISRLSSMVSRNVR